MAQQPNRLLRLIIPLALILVGVGVAMAVYVNSSNAPNRNAQQEEQANSETATDEQSPPPQESKPLVPETNEAASQPAGDDVASGDESGVVDEQPEQLVAAAEDGATSIGALRARKHAETQAFDPIGSINADGPKRMKLDFSPIGAGVESLRLASEFDSVENYTKYHVGGEEVGEEHHVQLQSQQASGTSYITPFAALWVEVEKQTVALIGSGIWQQTAPGSFEAIIENEDGEAVIRVSRRFVLADNTNDLRIEQSLENLSGVQLDASLVQFGPIDLPMDAVTYGGDKRRLRFGYMLKPELDINREVVLGKKYLTPRTNVLGPRDKSVTQWRNENTGKYFSPYVPARQVWPDPEGAKAGHELVWAAMTNRYYGVAVHAVESPATPLAFDSIERIDRVVLQESTQPKDGVLIMRLHGKKRTLAPGARSDETLVVYAGPLSKTRMEGSALATAAGVKELVVYNFGGPCAMCTFTWLSDPLLGMVRFLESFTYDWAVAIILLVFCVRGVLHPINRWSQIRMQRFAKQMQDLAPKQKKIQERYAGDKQKIQQEMAKLWREEGVNPAGMLGCLPMLLQSPIWIALYASLYFLYELRQQPAFYGMFQTLSGGAWPFMADLSEPDHFIPLPSSMHFSIPLMGLITAINVMPLLLAVVFYAHQKFLTPATASTLTPEQQSQQKMIKVMTVVMFPVIMYNAPCGLALYFIANSTIAIVENSWIRAHIKKHDLLEVKKKPRKPRGGFMSRLQEIADKQQAIREQQQRMRDGAKGGPKKPGGESAAQRAMRKGRE
ncbi:MAG: hypothetical protein Phyf2KO_15140 [Phycisphaerales bacterium]